MITNILINNIGNLLLKIKFYLNIQNNLFSNINIFTYIFNTNIKTNKKILNYLKKPSTMFNFRNKLNFNKSKRNITTKKKTGKARLGSSSSHILRKGLVWYGLRQLSLHKNKISNSLLQFFIVNKKNIITIHTLETTKLLYNMTLNIKQGYNRLSNYKVNKNLTCINCGVKNYIHLLNQPTNINLLY